MFIKSVKVINFRGIQEANFQFDENPFVLLAAPNGIGKTSVIDAIEWCLTGNIGRLKNSYDLRSTNASERKINVSGILKFKDARSEDRVSVEVCVKDGDEEHIICRKQEKDELECSSRGVEIWVDGKKHKKDDWLGKYINQNFYNYHFCDVQKSLGIQNEKRSSLSEMFKEFITDYSDEERVAENLALFQRDADLKINKKIEAKKKVEIQKNSVEEELEKLADTPSFQEYPKVVMYDGEVVDLQGKDRKFLQEQQNNIYSCGYSYVNDILKEKIENHKNEELCKNLDSLIQNLQENKENVKKAIRAGLDRNTTCIVECTKKIEEYEAVILDRNSILDRGKTIIKFNNASFTKKYFEQKKQEIQDLNEKIKNLDETIRAFSDGNEIIEALTNLIDKKQALAEYQRLRLGEGIQVRCPVCGSEKFAEIETQQILKEASDFLEVNKTNLNKKVEEKELKKRECNELKDKIILKAKEVLKTEIQKETESRENLLNVQKSTKEFFALQKRISSVLKDTNDIDWWSEADNLIDKKQKLEKKQISKEEMNKKQREVEDVLILLNFKIEATDSDQAIQNKISSRVEKAPKILVFTKKLLIEKMNALSYMIQDQEMAELNKKLKNSQNMIEELDNEIRRIKQVKEWAEVHEEKIKRLVAELIQQEYENVGPNLYKFYKKLSRINTIKIIKITPDGTENQVSLTDETGKHVVNILSNGQLSVFILAYFFAGIVSRGNDEKFKIYFIDDLTACMDDVNMLSFLDLMKYLLKEKEGPVDQMFFATCDERIEKLLCYKMDGCEIPYTKLTEKEFPKSIEKF